MLRIEEFVKSEIVKRLKDFEGCNLFLQDLGWGLFEYENCNGSFSCNSYDSIQWIKEYFEELDEIIEEYEIMYETIVNPFKEPEKFQLLIILYLSDKLVSNAIYNANLETNSVVKLTNEIINAIIEVL